MENPTAFQDTQFADIVELLSAAGNINKFAVARTLSETEINELEEAIKRFFHLIKSKHPGFPKRKTRLHILEYHVVPFVRIFKSWGKYGENCMSKYTKSEKSFFFLATESIHRVRNESDKRIFGKPDLDEARNKSFKKRHSLANIYC